MDRVDELERRVRELEQELAALRGWREAIHSRDAKTTAWTSIAIAAGAIMASAIISWLLSGGGSP